MGLSKGRTNNPAGRPRGSRNKNTEDLRFFVEGIINDNRAQIKRDLKELEPKSRLLILEKLMSYVLPKLQTVDQKINFDQLTDDQINSIISELTQDEN